MADARWTRIDILFHEALEHPAAERLEWLSHACGTDDDLRREIEMLLDYDASGQSFLDRSALAVAAASIGPDPPGALKGQRIGGYEVLDFLGAGGMGEVYRARDVRLGRDVALKMFENVASAEAMQRFEAEARSASVLNHPNIVTIYGVGDAADTAFIAMELVHGRTLRELLAGPPVEPLRCIDLLLQLAEGIAAAHAAGIVHRDLKPENVMVTPDGRIKVLDFGIARPQRELWAADAEASTAAALEGTVAYMSPEQASGAAVGPPSDQFSFGVIAFEMVSGSHPFARGTRQERLDAIINEPPPPLQLEGVIAPIVPVIARCLQKDPARRHASVGDVVDALRRIRSASGNGADARGPTRREILWIGGLTVTAAVAGGAAWLWSAAPRRTSLLVLPFGNPAADEGAEYLCDGIAETLIRQLTMVPSLSVVARATSFSFKHADGDPRLAGQQLGTRAVLTGVVRRRGTRVQISAELIDSTSGARIWGEEFDRPAGDVLAVQNGIAEAIIRDGLHVRLSDSDRQRLIRTFTTDPVAYEQFLLAIHHLRWTTEEGYLRARELLAGAVARDERFALALVTLASTYSAMAVDGYAPPAESWREGAPYVTRALAIDPALPDAHAEAASAAFFYRWDWAEADRRWDEALRSDRGPVQSELLSSRALQMWATGRAEAALEVARAARQVDPLSIQASLREADLLSALGRHEEAVTLYQKIIREQPQDARAHFGLSETKRKQGRFDEALAARRRAHQAAGDDSLEDLFQHARGETGYRSIVRVSAHNEIERLTRRQEDGAYACPLDFARAYAQLEDPSMAWASLTAALEERSAGLALLKVDPAWDTVRADARFTAAVARVGLP